MKTNAKTQKNDGFAERVRKVVRAIPKGNTLSYSDVANRVGKPRAARAVANVMSHNFDQTVPCHRVIRADGTLGGYNRGGESVKRKLLIEEGWKQS